MRRKSIVNLTKAQIAAALPRVEVGLEKYTWLQTELQGRVVSCDSEYQKRFGGFYRVRRNSAWRSAYFHILEDAKSRPISFEEALRSICDATGRVEASFASKLIATLDPSQPVIDSIVLENLGLGLPNRASSDRLVRVAALHQQLVELYSGYLSSECGNDLVAQFRRAYPTAQIAEVKMLDFVLWQTRAKA